MTTYAKVIADSISTDGIRLTTMELSYPRFIHSEFMTHRMFSRNASSSRAIPIEKMIKQVEEDPAMPVHWGKNQPGMQAIQRLREMEMQHCESEWHDAAENSIKSAKYLASQGLHKQIVNRLLEPFQWIKVIVTATEWDNFFKLRLAHDAQPEVQELARCMKKAMDESTPKILSPGEWHLPYVTEEERSTLDIEVLPKISGRRCARISYLNHDKSNPDVKADIARADELIAVEHLSPFEHQATPMKYTHYRECEQKWEKGVTHTDRISRQWSGNFRGFIQYRQLLEQGWV